MFTKFASRKFVFVLAGLISLVLCVALKWIGDGVFATCFVALVGSYLGGQAYLDSKVSTQDESGAGGQPKDSLGLEP